VVAREVGRRGDTNGEQGGLGPKTAAGNHVIQRECVSAKAVPPSLAAAISAPLVVFFYWGPYTSGDSHAQNGRIRPSDRQIRV